jgi:hypothetical protein
MINSYYKIFHLTNLENDSDLRNFSGGNFVGLKHPPTYLSLSNQFSLELLEHKRLNNTQTAKTQCLNNILARGHALRFMSGEGPKTDG